MPRCSSTKKVAEKNSNYFTSNASSLDKLAVDMSSENNRFFKKINNDSSTLIGTTQANSNCMSKSKLSCNNDSNYIEDCYFEKKRNSKTRLQSSCNNDSNYIEDCYFEKGGNSKTRQQKSCLNLSEVDTAIEEEYKLLLESKEKLGKELDKKKDNFNLLFQEKQINCGTNNQIPSEMNSYKNDNDHFECSTNIKSILSGIEDYEVSENIKI